MKKLIFTLFLLVTILPTKAMDIFPDFNPFYSIFSDTINNEVPENFFRISGNTLMMSSAMPLNDVLVANKDEKYKIKSNQNGEFQLDIPVEFQKVFFFKKGWSEVVIENHEFKNQHEIKINIYLSQNSNTGVKGDDKVKPQVKRKPVIYLYSPNQQNVNVSFQTKSDVIMTYPFYNNSWDVLVNAQGELIEEKTKKVYPYLFWEAKTQNLDFIFNEDGSMDGFLMKTDTIVSFFEKTLMNVGFNQKEITDFITYWAPEIMQKNYVLLQFLENDRYDKYISSLTINPKPDNIKRIFLLFSLFDSIENIRFRKINPQLLKSIDRDGFCVIEWGGANLNP